MTWSIIKKSGMSISFFYSENANWKKQGETVYETEWFDGSWNRNLRGSSATSFLALAAFAFLFQNQGGRSSTIWLRREAVCLFLNGVFSVEPSCRPLTTPIFPSLKCLPTAQAAERGRKVLQVLHPDRLEIKPELSRTCTRQFIKRPSP